MQISTKDRKKAQRMIRNLTPSKEVYRRYEAEAEAFIRDFKSAKRGLPANMIEILSLRMIESKYFGKKYLVAFVSQGWFDQTSSHCNAVASPSLSFIDLLSPPLVVIPGKSIPKSKGFSSIVEHEFVHVNQGIYNRFPNLTACELETDTLFGEMIKATSAEFEANFIQLVHDQTLAPDEALGVNLEKWCLLRGYTQSLETALLRISTEAGIVALAKGLLKRLEADLPIAFKKASLSEEIGHEFARDIEKMFQLAILILDGRQPDLKKNPAFVNIFKWVFRDSIAEYRKKS